MSKKVKIEALEIKNPCTEDWNAMTGNEEVRFCGHCATEVNNLSAMTRKQAMRLVRESGGRLCVRYVKSPVDNQPVFAERLHKITRRATVAAGVLSASLAFSTFAFAQGETKTENKETSAARVNQSGYFDPNEKEPDVSVGGSISGTVTDPNGAVVPQATILLVNIKTNETRSAQSDEAGAYSFKDLERGIYKLRFESANGFAAKETVPFQLAEGADMERNLALESNLTYEIMGGIGFVEFRTGLHRAVAGDEAQEVRNLISRGGSVNEKDENYANITPLFLAVENGNAEIAAMLLNFGAKANARDDNRQTPLMRLDEDASVELVNLLIRHGARVRVVDAEGNTPLILAARSVKADVLRILINHSSGVDAQNAAGRTALMEAADADNTEAVRALLEAGASVNLKDKEGETAYDLTTEEEIEKLLARYGAIVEPESN